jgi:formylglycine-generating enzyme required for sulfatase activity
LLVIAITYGFFLIKAELEIEARVESEMAHAKRALARARALGKRADSSRGRALALFDKTDKKEGEIVWSQYRTIEEQLQPIFGQASQSLENALLLDNEREDVRNMFADVLYERALLAESHRRQRESFEFIERLALYDTYNKRRKKWSEPASVTIKTIPADTSVTLWRFESNKAGLLIERPVELEGPKIENTQLSPGSYMAVIRAKGRTSVRYPFIARRGAEVSFRIELPEAHLVPPGFSYVPAGGFLFGSASSDDQRKDFFHHVPLHELETDGYLIARHETTFADWIEYLEGLPAEQRPEHYPKVEKGGFQGALGLEEHPVKGWIISFQPAGQLYRAAYSEKIIYSGRSRSRAQDWTELPVVGVSVADAERYVAWLNESGKLRGARLCTELEWERGARGADGREYPHGNSIRPDEANYDDTYGKDPKAMGPDQVGSHPKSLSPFGLYDMAGNVWEWTRSSVKPERYAARGGSYYFGANSAKTTDREITEPDFRDTSVGLRVCADLAR